EAVRALNIAGIPCSKVMAANDIAADPHYQTRDVHIKWTDEELGQVQGVGIVPKFSATPGKIWRGAVGVGRDNERVYRELLNLSEQELTALASEGTI
ncbi:MAG TPA: CoA transferase, partial [Candidatus Binataceae bacterium]